MFGPFIVFCLIFSFALSILFYTFRSIGVYKIAKANRLERAWTAFIPFFGLLKLADVSDAFYTKGKKKLKKPIAVFLTLTLIVAIFFFIVFDLFLADFLNNVAEYMNAGPEVEIQISNSMLASFGMIMLLSFPLSIFSIVYAVYHYILLYRIYSLYFGDDKVVYLLLSIFFDFLPPFFLFHIGKRPPLDQAPLPFEPNRPIVDCPRFDTAPHDDDGEFFN